MKQLDEQQLLALKKKIDSAKSEVSELKGQLKTLMEQLKNDYSCNTIEQAEKKIKTINIDIDNLTTKIEEALEEINKKYNQEE